MTGKTSDRRDARPDAAGIRTRREDEGVGGSSQAVPSRRRREVLKGAAVLAGLAVLGRLQRGRMPGYVSVATAAGTRYLRPPGAVDEEEFRRRCIRCHRCGENCTNSCIRFVGPEGPAEARGTPYIVPREKACILCQKCNNNCPSGALQPVDADHPRIWEAVRMGTATLDRNICHSYQGYVCGICIRACPLEGVALRADNWEKPVLDPERCVGCGLCEQACVHMPQALRVRPRSAGRRT